MSRKKNAKRSYKLTWIILFLALTTLLFAFIIIKNYQKQTNIIQYFSDKFPQSTSTKTNPEWNVYSNENLKFSFEYPQELTEITDNLPSTYTDEFGNEARLDIQSQDKKSNFNLFLNGKMGGGCWPMYRYTAKQSGDKIIYTKEYDENYPSNKNNALENCKDSRYLDLYLTLDNGNYFIGFYNDFKNSEDITEFEKILDTFRFTK